MGASGHRHLERDEARFVEARIGSVARHVGRRDRPERARHTVALAGRPERPNLLSHRMLLLLTLRFGPRFCGLWPMAYGLFPQFPTEPLSGVAKRPRQPNQLRPHLLRALEPL